MASQGLLKPNSGMQFTQACKGSLHASSGPDQADRKPLRAARSLLSPTVEKDPLRLKEDPLTLDRDLSSQHQDIIGRKGALSDQRRVLQAIKGPPGATESLSGQHKFLSIKQRDLLGRNRAHCRLEWPCKSTQEPIESKDGLLRPKEDPFRPKRALLAR